MGTGRNVIRWLVVMLMTGCGSDTPPNRVSDVSSGPMLIALDSVLLEEADTLYIGNPYTPVVDPWDGSLYIPDIFSGRVLRFGRDGHLLLTYGRPGDGPGELRVPSAIIVLDDSTLIAHDIRLLRFNLYDRRTGAHRGTRAFPSHTGTGPPVVTEHGVWIADYSMRQPTTVVLWDIAQDSLLRFGPLPPEYAISIAGGHWIFAETLSNGALALSDSGVLRGWAGLDYLTEMDRTGTVLRTIRIPAVRRRGSPPGLREMFDVERIGQREQLEASSRLRQLHRLTDGSYAMTFHDNRVLTLEPMPVMAADVFVAVVSADLQRACVDTSLPASIDARSMETFIGDTLVQLDRRITTDQRLETWVMRYLLSTEGCTWLPTGA